MRVDMNMFDAMDKVIAKVENKPCILCIGPVSAGKNTLINQLSGVRYERHVDPATREVLLRPRVDMPAVASKSTSPEHFRIPDVFEASDSDELYCVSPDLLNTDTMHQAYSRMSVPMVLNASKGMQAIMVVIDWATISANRATSFSGVMANIGQLFQDESCLFNQESGPAAFFVFTKIPDKETRRENIQAMIQDMYKNLREQLNLHPRDGDRQKLAESLQNAQSEKDRARELTILEAFDRETENLFAQLKMLAAINNAPSRIFISYTDGTFANGELTSLRSSLTGLPVFPASAVLKPIQYSKTVLNTVMPLIKSLNEKWQSEVCQLTVLEQEQTSLLQEKQDIAALLKQLTAPEMSVFQRETPEHQMIDKINKKIDSIAGAIARLNLEVDEKNTSDEVLHWQRSDEVTNATLIVGASAVLKGGIQLAKPLVGPYAPLLEGVFNFAIDNLAYLFRSVKKFDYEGIPFERVATESSIGTAFNHDELSVPHLGRYYISYSPSTNGHACVKIFAAKKLVFRDDIIRLGHELTVHQALLADLNREKNELVQLQEMTRNEKIIQGQANIKHIESMISTTKEEIVAHKNKMQQLLDRNEPLVSEVCSLNSRYAGYSSELTSFVRYALTLKEATDSFVPNDAPAHERTFSL